MRPMIVSAMLADPAITPAGAADVVGFRANAVRSIFHGSVPTCAKKPSNDVKFNFGTAGAIVKRVATGELGDVISTTACSLAELARANKIEGSTTNNLDGVAGEVAVKRDEHKPDTHNLATFEASMFAALSITCPNAAAGADLFMVRPEKTAQIGQTVVKAEGFSINHAVIQCTLSKVNMAPTFGPGWSSPRRRGLNRRRNNAPSWRT